MRSFTLLLAALVCSTCYGQMQDERVRVSVGEVKTVVGATQTELLGEAIVFTGPGRIAVSAKVVIETTYPSVMFSVLNTATLDATQYRGPYERDGKRLIIIDLPGRHRVEIDCIDWETKERFKDYATVTVTGQPDVTPEPGPKPPDPTPDVPAPIDGPGLRILLVYETSEIGKLTKKQQDIFYSATTRNYMSANCIQVDGTPDWRILDQDTKFTDVESRFAKALARPRLTLPWIIISNGKTGYEGPLPASPEETISLIEKYNE